MAILATIDEWPSTNGRPRMLRDYANRPQAFVDDHSQPQGPDRPLVNGSVASSADLRYNLPIPGRRAWIMTTQSITLQLSEPVFRYLQQVAAATRRPLEQVVRQSVEGNLPPSVDAMPADMRAELLALQVLPVEQLRQIAESQITAAEQTRHAAMLEKNSAGVLTSEEQEELATLRLSADRIMLRKAYAWAVLRWRGHAIPPLDELPLD